MSKTNVLQLVKLADFVRSKQVEIERGDYTNIALAKMASKALGVEIGEHRIRKIIADLQMKIPQVIHNGNTGLSAVHSRMLEIEKRLAEIEATIAPFKTGG